MPLSMRPVDGQGGFADARHAADDHDVNRRVRWIGQPVKLGHETVVPHEIPDVAGELTWRHIAGRWIRVMSTRAAPSRVRCRCLVALGQVDVRGEVNRLAEPVPEESKERSGLICPANGRRDRNPGLGKGLVEFVQSYKWFQGNERGLKPSHMYQVLHEDLLRAKQILVHVVA